MKSRTTRVMAISAVAALALAACGDDEEEGTTATTAAAAQTTVATEDSTADSTADTAAGEDGVLAGVCPETVVIQTDWNPEAEHGWIYEMIGDGYEIDATAVAVRGPLVAGGVDTGVDIEIRSGGPAIGYQTVTSQMYTDESIMLGYVYTDEAIQNSSDFPTIAVMAGMEKNPQMIMWDPETYPDVETIADIGEAGITTLYFGGAAYMDYFTQTGILSADQVDGSYDGTPARFTGEQGAVAQQGFGSAEPYIYANEVTDWMKPVNYAYINDAGWENYAESIAIRADSLEDNRACLELLVPIIQQSSVDFVTDPAETNAVIIDAVDTYDNGWIYSAEVAEYGVATMLGDGLLSNGPDDTLGNFDMDRVNGLIEIAIPVYESLGQTPKEGLTAEDIVTNEFIDESIGL
ncbi:MAG TPA: hypothetical protein VMM60_16340 [Ilumatobacter sp.]|nr:hypothetical protein [Ilumatobacter sp.]